MPAMPDDMPTVVLPTPGAPPTGTRRLGRGRTDTIGSMPNPSTRVRAAIVGAGFAASSHVDALSRLRDVELTGLLGSSPERGREGVARLGVGRAYETLDELLDDGVDVVHVCTPNVAHAAVTFAALERGVHVVSEKPLGFDAGEAVSLADAAERAGVVAAVCFNYRFFPLVRQLRWAIAAGDEGPVHLVHGTYLQDWLLHEDDWNWRLTSSVAGSSRAVADIGSHWFDLVQHVTGDRVVAVAAQLGRLHERRRRPSEVGQTFATGAGDGELVDVDTEDMATVLFRLGSGASGACTISQVSSGRKNRLVLEVSTAAATFAWSQEEPNELWIGRRDRADERLVRDPSLLGPAAAPLAHFPGGHQEGWPDALRNLMLDVYAAVRAHGAGERREGSFATFPEAAQVQRLVEAIVLSDGKGAWVDVQSLLPP
jgi:predicted dehydrogenase